jgi:hypothetical protein
LEGNVRGLIMVLLYSLLEGLREISEALPRVAGLPADIRPQHLPNKSRKCYNSRNISVTRYRIPENLKRSVATTSYSLRGPVSEFYVESSLQCRDRNQV